MLFLLSASGCMNTVRIPDSLENQVHWDIDTAISLCLSEVIGKAVEALDGIDYDAHRELEDCVNEKVDSRERLKLAYRGSEKGLVPYIYKGN